VVEGLSFVHSPEDGFDVEYGSAVDRFEVVDRDGLFLYRFDHDGVQADRVGTIRRARREHSLAWPVHVAAWVYTEHVAATLMQPGQHEYLITFLQIPGSFVKLG